MTAVVERLEPEELFEWFLGQRAAMGLTGVPARRGVECGADSRALKNNQLAGLVSDRDLVGNGVEVEFFGEKTTLPGGAATLALRTGAPLMPVVVYSGPGNWHTGVVHAPIDTTRQGTLAPGHRPGDPGAASLSSSTTSAAGPSSGTCTSPTGRAIRDEPPSRGRTR